MLVHDKQLPKTLFLFIWYFLKPYKLMILIFTTFAICGGFYAPFNHILVKHTIDLLPQTQNGDISILMLPLSLIVLNFIIFENFTLRGITYIRAKFVPIIINQIIGQSMDYVLDQSHQFFQDRLSGKISKQITNLADGIERLIENVIANFLRCSVLLLVSIVATYFVNPVFSFIMIIWFILFAGASIFMSKKIILLSDAQAAAEAIVVGELVDSISNQNNVRIFARKSYECLRMEPFFNKQQKTYTAVYFYYFIMNSVQGTLIAIMVACCCYFLADFYGKNLVTAGDFVLIIGLAVETSYMMWHLMSVVATFNQAVGRCKQSLSSIMAPLEIKDKSDATTLKCTGGQIIFDKVKFHYKNTEALFQNKSIEIKAEQKVGLVGYSGSGKSSFVNLILRLYDVTKGAILIDSQNIRDVTQDSLRENIAMIPQDPSLFHRSLMDNIRYGLVDASDAEVIEAAKKAHAHEFITKLPQGYNSLVGERGVKLSGGQRQRIAVARAILKNAPILILDEATSQLDSVTEGFIQAALRELMQNKTTIVVAHRLSTLLHMDRILVFNEGKIVEDDTHSELLAKGGLYKKLWDAQIGGFLGDKKAEK